MSNVSLSFHQQRAFPKKPIPNTGRAVFSLPFLLNGSRRWVVVLSVCRSHTKKKFEVTDIISRLVFYIHLIRYFPISVGGMVKFERSLKLWVCWKRDVGRGGKGGVGRME